MQSYAGIDPGEKQSAIAVINYNPITKEYNLVSVATHENVYMLDVIIPDIPMTTQIGIERLIPYGFRVGGEVFRTIEWTGRFYEKIRSRPSGEPTWVRRQDVRVFLCGSAQYGNDSSIRKALIDIYGTGTKKLVKKDGWAALGVAHTLAAYQF